MKQESAHCCALCGNENIKKIFVSRNQHGRHLLDAADTFDVFSCAECESIFLGKRVINADYYKKYYREGYYESSHHSVLQKLLGLLTKYVINKKQKLMFRYFRKKDKISILDVGCGAGGFLLRLNDKKFSKSGVEINPEAVAICKKKGLNVYAQNLLEIFSNCFTICSEFLFIGYKLFTVSIIFLTICSKFLFI